MRDHREYNGVMMQYFHWYTEADGTLWQRLAREAPALAAAGVTSVWLPPAYKGASGGLDVGYAVYDLFDLGEFDQKGSVRTKYGTREEYLQAIRAAQAAGIQVYADIVFNHKLGADGEEEFEATPFDPEDRTQPVGPLQPVRAWTHFTFPGRGRAAGSDGRMPYSELQWHWWHFNAADHNALDEKTSAVYLFEGKAFDENVDREKGNYDYLMGCNLDINNPDVRKELFYWGEWYLDTTGVDGFRFDAVKHVKSTFFLDWLHHLRVHAGRDLFAVGEYWSGEPEALQSFIEDTGGNLMLFDVALHYHFAEASRKEADYDMRTIFEGTLVREHPTLAVTLVSNHDSQPLQSLESVVEAWFKPLAYALILLRRDGYPCVFAADYYGAHYTDRGRDGREYEIWMERHQWMIDRFLEVRRDYAYGEQRDYFEESTCIGWTRHGNGDHPGGAAVVLSTAGAGEREMRTGSPHTAYEDATGHIPERVITDGEGRGLFRCPERSVSVWVARRER
ncbi:MAG: alpha-amylase [Spirochaetaceae bacterium]|nr:MAG: alpha-amylase [Spirochaetaceae bacterium]